MNARIPESERPVVWRLFIYSMILAASYTLVRTVGDSLFLARLGSENLAWVYVASGLTTALIASIWFALARKFPLTATLKVSGFSFGFLSLLAWFLLPWFHHSMVLLAAIYLLAEVKGCVNAINIVSSMSTGLGGHANRESWAKVGLGFPLATVLIGLLIGFESSVFDIRTWLLLSAVLDFVGLIPVWSSKHTRVAKVPKRTRRGDEMFSLLKRVHKTVRQYACCRQFRFWIGCLIATKVFVLTIVSFEWKVSVNSLLEGDEARLTSYFGIFYAVTGVITLLLQAFVAGPLLNRRRIAVPLLVMPASLLFFNTLFVFGAGVLFLAAIATMAKLMEVWRRSVHDTTLGFLYTKIERRKRRSTIAFNSGVVKPLSEVSASLLLLLGTATFHQYVLISLTALWLLSTLSLVRLIRKFEKSKMDLAEDRSRVKQLASGLLHNQ